MTFADRGGTAQKVDIAAPLLLTLAFAEAGFEEIS